MPPDAVERWACWFLDAGGRRVGCVWHVWGPISRARLFVEHSVANLGPGSVGYCQATGGGWVWSKSFDSAWEALP